MAFESFNVDSEIKIFPAGQRSSIFIRIAIGHSINLTEFDDSFAAIPFQQFSRNCVGQLTNLNYRAQETQTHGIQCEVDGAVRKCALSKLTAYLGTVSIEDLCMLGYDRKRDTLTLSVRPSFAVGMISFLAGAFFGAFLVESIDNRFSRKALTNLGRWAFGFLREQ